MPNTNNNNGVKQSESEVTLKEVSQKLDISESTVRKYLRDFDLKTERGSGGRAILSSETFKALIEISKLRANGLSIQEIKELKTQEPSKTILDQIEEGAKTVKVEKEGMVSEGDINISAEEILEAKSAKTEFDLEKEEETEDRQEEQGEEETQEEVTEKPHEEGELQEAPRRRRLFNFRYVERQISTDSKRVSSLRQRLRNPNLSVQDKLFYEEALERRILLLDGWKHILRWVGK